MTITIDRLLAQTFVKATKEDDQKEVIRAYKHYKRRLEDPIMEKYITKFYIKYFRDKYKFVRIIWKQK